VFEQYEAQVFAAPVLEQWLVQAAAPGSIAAMMKATPMMRTATVRREVVVLVEEDIVLVGWLVVLVVWLFVFVG
jgi:hypothetical protein